MWLFLLILIFLANINLIGGICSECDTICRKSSKDDAGVAVACHSCIQNRCYNSQPDSPGPTTIIDCPDCVQHCDDSGQNYRSLGFAAIRGTAISYARLSDNCSSCLFNKCRNVKQNFTGIVGNTQSEESQDSTVGSQPAASESSTVNRNGYLFINVGDSASGIHGSFSHSIVNDDEGSLSSSTETSTSITPASTPSDSESKLDDSFLRLLNRHVARLPERINQLYALKKHKQATYFGGVSSSSVGGTSLASVGSGTSSLSSSSASASSGVRASASSISAASATSTDWTSNLAAWLAFGN